MERVSLVVPAHNGAKVIEDSIKKYSKIFLENFDEFEIIVVCNDCWDDTVRIANSLSKIYPVKVIEIPQRGKGYALNEGFKVAKYDLLGFIDADNPFDLDKIIYMIKKLSRFDVAIASKYFAKGFRIRDSFMRRMISLGGGFISKFILGLNFRDTQAGGKFFRRSVWDRIHFNWKCTGFDWDIEFLYKSIRNKFKIVEVYIPICREEKFSTFRLKYIPGIFKRVLKLRFL